MKLVLCICMVPAFLLAYTLGSTTGIVLCVAATLSGLAHLDSSSRY